MDLDVHGGSEKTSDNLKQVATINLKWSYAAQLGKQFIQLVSMVIIVRLLKPEDLGLMSMAMVVIGFMTVFRDLGTSAAVIQKKDPSPQLLSSLFWTNVFFAGLLIIGIWFTAPLIAGFYNEPALAGLLRWMAWIFILQASGTIHQAVLEKNLHFGRLATIEIMASVLSSSIGIMAAFMGCRVWSLVYQSLTFAALNMLLLWLTSKWVPRFQWGWAQLKEVKSYSLNLSGFNLVNFISRNADYFLIGKFLGAQPLGYYTLAYRIMLYPVENISTVIGRVMFPVYSKVQDDQARLHRAVIKVCQTIAFATFPVMLGFWAVCPQFVHLVWGPAWDPVITLLRILVPIGMLQSIGSTVGVLYQASGRTDILMKWGVGASGVTILSFIIGLHWGIIGVAAAYSIASLLLFYPGLSIPFHLIRLPMRQFGLAMWRVFLSASLMWSCVILVQYPIRELNPLPQLGLLIPTGILFYALCSWRFNRTHLREIQEELFRR
jgi:O-antigen/teichoic acid export membrane protein